MRSEPMGAAAAGSSAWFPRAAHTDLTLPPRLYGGGTHFRDLHIFLRTGFMVKLQSSMSKHIPQFCGVLGHTFMEFLKGSGDYCQAQHGVYADE
ncbi:hypothetical protein HF521_022682 [Silurus meridionalis]|uniref:Uncharacterized protein n=1 Tax=Silurus meridionalis TaxID=175797 RepID=A0A8T0BA38_SILME|nr:hypothetical protein HF521_022682 [Silurus meridionalis]